MNSSPTDDGFTLIELLVVVIIIGILAAIAIPTFLSQRERGWQGQLVSDVRNSAVDIEAGFVANSGLYPATQAEFLALGARRSSPTITLAYTTNSTRTEFCVTGTDSRLPAAQQIVSFKNASGLRTFTPCPAFTNP